MVESPIVFFFKIFIYSLIQIKRIINAHGINIEFKHIVFLPSLLNSHLVFF